MRMFETDASWGLSPGRGSKRHVRKWRRRHAWARWYARRGSVMNRRNAMLGWPPWASAHKVLKRKADAKAEVVVEEAPRRFGRRRAVVVVEEPKKKRRKWPLLALVSATAVGVGLWMRGQAKGPEPYE